MNFRLRKREQEQQAGAGETISCATFCVTSAVFASLRLFVSTQTNNKRQTLRRCASRFLPILLLVFTLAFASITHAQQSSEAPLTNSSIIRLVKAGFKEKTVIAIIHSRPNQFKLDTEHLIQLKHNGVGENIILAMLSQDPSFASGEEWGDDEFFRTPGGRSTNGRDSGPDIFGSSGGSKSESRSRGARGGNQNEGNVTGSATVRILRPPAEAGGPPAKLEKTPSLTNEEIIRLVAAGFSEGTIIKRIENSPAEFDLSPAKLEELHKNRVTDPIIAAMTTAMGEREPETAKRSNP
jgi:hypothetical protein